MIEKKNDINQAFRITFIVNKKYREVGKAFLYILYNDTHKEPYGLFGDILVEEQHRGKGYGKQLIKAVIDEAKQQGCYKLVATSRDTRLAVHALYTACGFQKWGIEFRMNLLSIV